MSVFNINTTNTIYPYTDPWNPFRGDDAASTEKDNSFGIIPTRQASGTEGRNGAIAFNSAGISIAPFTIGKKVQQKDFAGGKFDFSANVVPSVNYIATSSEYYTKGADVFDIKVSVPLAARQSWVDGLVYLGLNINPMGSLTARTRAPFNGNLQLLTSTASLGVVPIKDSDKNEILAISYTFAMNCGLLNTDLEGDYTAYGNTPGTLKNPNLWGKVNLKLKMPSKVLSGGKKTTGYSVDFYWKHKYGGSGQNQPGELGFHDEWSRIGMYANVGTFNFNTEFYKNPNYHNEVTFDVLVGAGGLKFKPFEWIGIKDSNLSVSVGMADVIGTLSPGGSGELLLDLGATGRMGDVPILAKFSFSIPIKMAGKDPYVVNPPTASVNNLWSDPVLKRDGGGVQATKTVELPYVTTCTDVEKIQINIDSSGFYYQARSCTWNGSSNVLGGWVYDTPCPGIQTSIKDVILYDEITGQSYTILSGANIPADGSTYTIPTDNAGFVAWKNKMKAIGSGEVKIRVKVVYSAGITGSVDDLTVKEEVAGGTYWDPNWGLEAANYVESQTDWLTDDDPTKYNWNSDWIAGAPYDALTNDIPYGRKRAVCSFNVGITSVN